MKLEGFYHDGIVRLEPCGCVTADYDLEDDDGNKLTVKLTHEGVIIDLVDSDGEVIGTFGATADELAEMTM